MMQDSDGSMYDLSVMNRTQRLGKARLLLANNTPGSAPKIVFRHLRDGDAVIMNRQPTLHRASMMCHFVRVLKVGSDNILMDSLICVSNEWISRMNGLVK